MYWLYVDNIQEYKKKKEASNPFETFFISLVYVVQAPDTFHRLHGYQRVHKPLEPNIFNPF